MTCGRATGWLPMTAAKAALGCRPAAPLVLRGNLGLEVLTTDLAASSFLGTFLALVAVLAAAAIPAFVAATVLTGGWTAVLRGGNLDGANSKLTLPACASHASMAL